jgi:hypothetical protein
MPSPGLPAWESQLPSDLHNLPLRRPRAPAGPPTKVHGRGSVPVCAKAVEARFAHVRGGNAIARTPPVSARSDAGRRPNDRRGGGPKPSIANNTRPPSETDALDNVRSRPRRRPGRAKRWSPAPSRRARGHASEISPRIFATAPAVTNRVAPPVARRRGTATAPAARSCGGSTIANASGCAARPAAPAVGAAASATSTETRRLTNRPRWS